MKTRLFSPHVLCEIVYKIVKNIPFFSSKFHSPILVVAMCTAKRWYFSPPLQPIQNTNIQPRFELATPKPLTNPPPIHPKSTLLVYRSTTKWKLITWASVAEAQLIQVSFWSPANAYLQSSFLLLFTPYPCLTPHLSSKGLPLWSSSYTSDPQAHALVNHYEPPFILLSPKHTPLVKF